MKMNNDWQALFDQEIQKDYLKKIDYFLAREYKTKPIYPKAENIFHAFQMTSLKDTKVVIVGQDPYHGPGQAQGFSFSVPGPFPLLYKTFIKNWKTNFNNRFDVVEI